MDSPSNQQHNSIHCIIYCKDLWEHPDDKEMARRLLGDKKMQFPSEGNQVLGCSFEKFNEFKQDLLSSLVGLAIQMRGVIASNIDVKLEFYN